jgi:nicotinate-nucleotide adenylyltransferase
MLKIATRGHKGLLIDETEIKNKAFSSIDTILQLRQKHGRVRPIIICLGIDSFFNFREWHRWQEILESSNLLVLNRPNTGLEIKSGSFDWCQKRTCVHDSLIKKPAGFISFANLGMHYVSSTNIRSYINDGRKVPKGMMSSKVLSYIARHNLYKKQQIT